MLFLYKNYLQSRFIGLNQRIISSNLILNLPKHVFLSRYETAVDRLSAIQMSRILPESLSHLVKFEFLTAVLPRRRSSLMLRHAD